MNGLTPPKSGATEWPPGPTPRAPRGAPEPRDAFAGILDSHQARTATAEGQDRSPKVQGQKRRDADGAEHEHPVQHHADDVQAKPADSATTAVVPVADEQPAGELPVPAVPVVTPVAVEVAPVQTPAQPVAQQPQAPVVVADAPETPKAEQPQAAQTVAQAQPEQPEVAEPAAADAPVVAVGETAPTAPQADAKPADRPEQPALATAAKPKQQPGETGQQGEPKQQGSLPQPAADQARTVAQAYGRPQHTSTEVPTPAQSGTPTAPAATPVAAGQPAAAARGEFAPATPVPLARAAENVEHVLRLAANRGVTHARIALNPESLGSVDVHLRHTSDGLIATVVAHSPEAVQQLQQAAADLRRQLEGQGLNLLSLDIGQSSDDPQAAGAGTAFGDGQGERSSSSNASGSAAGSDEETTVKSTLQLPNGVLVDVLA